jgi:hypothetical protein
MRLSSETAAEMAAVALPYTTPRLAGATMAHWDALDELSLGKLRQLLAV